MHTYVHAYTCTCMHICIHSTHMYIHMHIHVCIHMYVHVHIYTHVHTCIIHTHMCTCINMYTHVHVDVCASMHMYIHMFIYTCMHMYICACIHTYIWKLIDVQVNGWMMGICQGALIDRWLMDLWMGVGMIDVWVEEEKKSLVDYIARADQEPLLLSQVILSVLQNLQRGPDWQPLSFSHPRWELEDSPGTWGLWSILDHKQVRSRPRAEMATQGKSKKTEWVCGLPASQSETV